MPLEAPLPPPQVRVSALNERYANHSGHDVLRRALTDPLIGPITLVSSFGAESVVLLHLISIMDKSVPIIFLDTEMLFEQTLDYKKTLSKKLGLRDVRTIRANEAELKLGDPGSVLHKTAPDQCCALRKNKPLEKALSDFDAWITGRKRFQGSARGEMQFFETDGLGRIKVNPLAHWSPQNVQEYMDNNGLPRHPLVSQGYASIGCAPCTSPVAKGDDPRAGRWRGSEKTECGIHFGKIGTITRSGALE